MQTHDWKKVGTTTYVARTHFDDGDWVYAKDGVRRESRSLAVVEHWLLAELKKLQAKEPGWWGLIERGTYEDVSFDDPGYGHVQDASWEPDETFEWEMPEMVTVQR